MINQVAKCSIYLLLGKILETGNVQTSNINSRTSIQVSMTLNQHPTRKEVIRMYKVVYQLPFNSIREIFLSKEELDSWLRWRWLRERIMSYERVG